MEKIRQASENAVVLADEALLLDPDPLYVDFCFKVLSKREKSLHREALKKEKNAEIQRGSATGNGGDSHWEGSSFTSWLMADAGMDCNFKSFRMGCGPHLRIGMGKENESWDQNGEESDLILASA